LSWLFVGGSAVFSAVPLAVTSLLLGTAVFALGETLWSPTFPALLNDLAPEALRGRYNALGSMSWQAAGVVGPVIAGTMLGAGLGLAWILLTAGCCLVGSAGAYALHRRISPSVDGLLVPIG
jgi:MFS family permease